MNTEQSKHSKVCLSKADTMGRREWQMMELRIHCGFFHPVLRSALVPSTTGLQMAGTGAGCRAEKDGGVEGNWGFPFAAAGLVKDFSLDSGAGPTGLASFTNPRFTDALFT